MNNFKWNMTKDCEYPKQGSLVEIYNHGDCMAAMGFVTDEGKFWVENKTGVIGDENSIEKWRHAKIMEQIK